MAASRFDRAYYERFYFNPRTRIAEPAYFDRLAAFICAYLRLIECPVKRVLDVGCGAGLLHPGLRAAFPNVHIDACDASEYICQRYGWTHSTIETLEIERSYDLVICHDVLQYLDRGAAALAIEKLTAATHGALQFGVLTHEDWEQNCDQTRTDDDVHLRPAAWYRRRLAGAFRNAGGGLYIRRDADIVLYELESF